MMLSGLGGPRTVLALTFALFSLIIFPEVVKQKPKARHGTTVRGGLYSSSESHGSVEERGPDFVLKHVSDGTTMLVVYYASWCPHCRTYAPKFIQYSKLSSDYSTVFSAVDCATYESLCDAMKITSYPTVVAYNFVRDGKSVTSSLGSHVDSKRVKTYLKTYGTKTSSSSSSSSDRRVAADEQSVSMDSKRLWIEQRVAAKARRASASERLGDALSSLKYLLISETPRLVVGRLKESRDRMEALLLLLRVVSSLLPKHSAFSEGWPDVSSALSWAERNSADTKLDEAQWRRGMSRALAGDATFKQHKTHLRSGASSRVDSHSSSSNDGSKIVWKVCGVTRNETSHADSGYTCGLWLLMHYLTVAGKELSLSSSSRDGSSSSEQMTASSVEAAIHALVAKLFTCSLCRKHFLAAYDSCALGRCRSEGDSEGDSESQDVAFDRLQLWLFRLHNAVTARVSKDYLGGAFAVTSSEDSADATGPSESASASSPPDSLGNKVLWPGSKLGGDGVDPLLVVRHLRQSYWDEQWLE